MPRTARKKSESGIYHIIMRGINRQIVFEDDSDREKFLKTLFYYKEKCGYSIFAYCLMANHIHLLLKINKEPLEQVMRRLCCSYVIWYNKKYERIGNLFQDRFRSEPVEDDSYFFTVIRYIHQNPLKAGLVKDISKYRWSSYNQYLRNNKILDSDYVLKMFSDDKLLALNRFKTFNSEVNDDKCIEIEDKQCKLKDEQLIMLIEKQFNISADMIKREPKEKRTNILRSLLEVDGVTTRQLSKVTGLSARTIWRL